MAGEAVPDAPSRSSCNRWFVDPATDILGPQLRRGQREFMSDHDATAPPRKVVLFSGHMIDAPGRREPRFPADKEPVAAAAIAGALNRLCAGAEDLAICSGACGGDLLFAEAALERRVRLELYLPFDEPTFLARSVDFADRDWRARYRAVRSQATLHVMPAERGPTPEGENPYERDNLWMLEAATRFGAGKVDFICLWNGQQGDGPGGTRHLMKEVERRAGRAHWLDTRRLWR